MDETHRFNNPEFKPIVLEVSQLNKAQLLELAKYLKEQRINIRQKLLQTGVVSAGYEKFGAIQLEGGKIGFRPNQNNELIVGTPQQFLEMLKQVNEDL